MWKFCAKAKFLQNFGGITPETLPKLCLSTKGKLCILLQSSHLLKKIIAPRILNLLVTYRFSTIKYQDVAGKQRAK